MLNFAVSEADLIIQLGFVIVIISQRRMNLCQGQVPVLKMDFLRTPPVSDHVQRNLDDFGVRVVNPRHAMIIQVYMCDS